VPEERGGLGLEASAALVASRVFGAALHGSAYPALVAAGFALGRWLPRESEAVCAGIVAGRRLPALAFLEPSARIAEGADAVRIDGCARGVLGAAESDSFLVLPAGGAAMHFVAARDGASLANPDAFDVTRSVADVVFDGARGTPLSGGLSERRLTERLFGLLLAGDALGGAERTLERTRLFALERHAFGKPLGGFQAVQHRLVDHTVQLRGMTLLAADAAEAMTHGREDAQRASLLAEASISAGALHVLHDLLQLTGAIGFTWEHGLHLYERRAHLDARAGRNPRAALRSLAAVDFETLEESLDATGP
jgi:alkylation response protein AidB-like acyl-CoA dehydrogenase